jgi:hypothetical protein
MSEYVALPAARPSIFYREQLMDSHTPHKNHRPPKNVGDDSEPGLLPVEPDQGPLQPALPADPEHDRVVDPEA